jgi:formylglycine-generating enzyme required for sulfatase activity
MKFISNTLCAVLLSVFSFAAQNSLHADTFGSEANTFAIDFVNIGTPNNSADTTGYGAVPYEYRIGKFEISQDQIDKATADGMANVTAGAWSGMRPAAIISWYEAAAFANWLNTSTGRQAAYDLTWSGSEWTMNLWSSGDAWQLGGENLYRHKDAYYFLPSEDEWYKAAYYNGTSYFDYPIGSDTPPTSVTSGTNAGTAVYNQFAWELLPANVDITGGLSPYGTMGQGGNVMELIETEIDGSNLSPSAARPFRGGFWYESEVALSSSARNGNTPTTESFYLGFRVASVPEPSTYALLLMTGAGALWLARKKRYKFPKNN